MPRSEVSLTSTLKATVTQILVAAVPEKIRQRRRRHPRRVALRRFFRRPAAPYPQPGVDPVALVVLAIDRLGPASVRACALGRPLEVAVPDAQTAAIFRSALAVTQQRRSTDRLISIVIRGDAA